METIDLQDLSELKFKREEFVCEYYDAELHSGKLTRSVERVSITQF